MSIRRLSIILSMLLLCGFGLASIVPSRIAVLDNRVISDNEVLEILNIQRGKEISGSELEEAIERVKNSGYFSDVYHSFDEA
ncbi:MAG TPA: POTRA domain-containing protein, partial [Mesotoga sp.]|nr:POTRA domain-containing protein [Mesotoga sp.]